MKNNFFPLIALLLLSIISISFFSFDNAQASGLSITEPDYDINIIEEMEQITADGTGWENLRNWQDKNYVINEGLAQGNGNGYIVLAIWNDNKIGNWQDFIADDISTIKIYTDYYCYWNKTTGDFGACDTGGDSIIYNFYKVKYNKAWYDLQIANGTQVPADGLNGGSVGTENPLNPDNTKIPRCSVFDVACWFNATIDNVVNSFESLGTLIQDLFKGLGEWILNIFVPSNAEGGLDDIIADLFTTMHETLRQRLGFLLFPFDFMADFFNEIAEQRFRADTNNLNAKKNDCYAGANLTIPKLLGNEDVVFDLCGFAEKMPIIWQTMRVIASLAWTIGIIGFLHMKYMDIVKGGDNE